VNQRRAISSEQALEVKSIVPPDDYRGQGLHWFRVTFEDGAGHCFISSGEAQHLRQLSTEWVKRALHNLARIRGWEWLENRACRSPGLMLHHTDASEVNPSRFT
jgi:hypothetical protein